MYDLENTFEGKEAEVPAESTSTEDCGALNIEALDHESEEEVAGGYVYKCNNHPDYKYEVISNKTGGVVGRFTNYEEAVKAIDHYNKQMIAKYGEKCAKPCLISTDRLWTYSPLKQIREEYQRGERKCINRIIIPR